MEVCIYTQIQISVRKHKVVRCSIFSSSFDIRIPLCSHSRRKRHTFPVTPQPTVTHANTQTHPYACKLGNAHKRICRCTIVSCVSVAGSALRHSFFAVGSLLVALVGSNSHNRCL
ncbi:unnamed protein product [Ceratitis capitata]|uniref:(Mediterranean fruit fly) hypothetical protein n=1 Tax=Ceratitis capitata TaxID=7213 RepID=A0A811V331_CERCA|nr:unnamed protein product [Ceratitis capitata]